MKSIVALVLLAGVAVVTAYPYYYPSEKKQCCAWSHTCKPRGFVPGTRPACRPPRNCCPDTRCFNNLKLLRYVFYPTYPVPFLSRMCCKVVNCAWYHQCSYAMDNCHLPYRPPFRPGCPGYSSARSRAASYYMSPYKICAPWRYVRRTLRIVCPNRRAYWVYRYLPYCCTCTVCPGHCHHK